jgi:hypothetical protein
MGHSKKNQNQSSIYYVAFNPLTDKYSIGEVSKGLQIETGLPCLFTSSVKKTAYDMAFSEWSEDEDGNISGTLREYEFSVYPESEEEDLNQVVSEINKSSNFKISSLKRKDSTDKLLMFSEYSYSKLPKSAGDILKAKKESKDGKRLKKMDALK